MRTLRRLSPFLVALFVIEFMDELVFSSREAAWPLIRTDLHLNYIQIGLLLSLPVVVSFVIESVMGILGDTALRQNIIRVGGVFFAVSVILMGLSPSYLGLLLAFMLGYPASGAFVSLSQAVLMDTDSNRHEQNMARWTFSGSLGVVAGPLLLGGAAVLALGWRGLFLVLGVLLFAIVVGIWRIPGLKYQPVRAEAAGETHPGFRQGLINAWQALRRKEVFRWVMLLQFSDLMLDVLYGYLALYFVDVAGLTPVTAGLAVGVWTGAGLIGDFLLIPLLERVRGLAYLRVSIWAELILFPVFLLAPWLWVKLFFVGLLGMFNSGWYAILQGRLYSSMHGQSGTVITLDNVGGLFGSIIPLVVGAAAERYGLGNAIWLLLLGPVALLLGVPRNIPEDRQPAEDP